MVATITNDGLNARPSTAIRSVMPSATVASHAGAARRQAVGQSQTRQAAHAAPSATANGHATRTKPSIPASAWWLRRPMTTNATTTATSAAKASVAAREELDTPPLCNSVPGMADLDLSGAHAVAATIATSAGDLLLDIRRQLDDADHDAGAVRAEGDRRSHDLIVGELARLRPSDPILSEEGDDDPGRAGSDHAWIVDPLDGTREFGEPGRTDWAVHVAFVVEKAVQAAAVALPARGLTLRMDEPPSLPPLGLGPPRIAVSRTRPPQLAEHLTAVLGAELVPMGSAGAKAMAVVLGDADIYVHAGGQWEWDSAAPVGVAAATGLHVSRIDGSPLRYNQPHPWLPDLLICRRELGGPVLDIIATIGPTT